MPYASRVWRGARLWVSLAGMGAWSSGRVPHPCHWRGRHQQRAAGGRGLPASRGAASALSHTAAPSLDVWGSRGWGRRARARGGRQTGMALWGCSWHMAGSGLVGGQGGRRRPDGRSLAMQRQLSAWQGLGGARRPLAWRCGGRERARRHTAATPMSVVDTCVEQFGLCGAVVGGRQRSRRAFPQPRAPSGGGRGRIPRPRATPPALARPPGIA